MYSFSVTDLHVFYFYVPNLIDLKPRVQPCLQKLGGHALPLFLQQPHTHS